VFVTINSLITCLKLVGVRSGNLAINMKKEDFDSVFFYVAKLTFIIPIAVVLIALLLKFETSNSVRTVSLTPTPSQKLNIDEYRGKINISIKGPLVCLYNNSSASISAYIKDRQIFTQVTKGEKTDKFLIKDDCFYHWEKDKFSGEKTCGISSFLSTFEMFSQFNLIGLEDLIGIFSEAGLPISTNEADASKMVRFCKEENVDDNTFVVPNNILFKNSSLLNPSAILSPPVFR